MRAARSQSACSGARLTTLPSSRPTFTRTGSPPTSTVRLERSSSIRSRCAIRTPSVLVSRSIASATARSASGRASADMTNPGRPRFICTGRGPDVERAGLEAGGGGVRGELGEQVVEVGLDQRDGAGRRVGADDHADDVRDALRGRACRRRSRRLRASCAGAGRSASASAATSAAPVGVTSSSSISTPCTGAPRSSSSVAGAGSGRRPCAASTKPRPIGSGEQIDAVDAERLERERDADHLADGVDRADLVEVHGLGLDTVDLPLGVREPPERLLRPGRAPAREGRARRSRPGSTPSRDAAAKPARARSPSPR